MRRRRRQATDKTSESLPDPNCCYMCAGRLWRSRRRRRRQRWGPRGPSAASTRATLAARAPRRPCAKSGDSGARHFYITLACQTVFMRADGCAAAGQRQYSEYTVSLAFGAVHLGISSCAVFLTVSGVRRVCAYQVVMMEIQDHLKLWSTYWSLLLARRSGQVSFRDRKRKT